MNQAIAIVGMACRYADSRSPAELWENVLAQRRAFRQIPDQRLRLADYFSSDRNTSDHTYSSQACLIEDYAFDRERFQVAGTVFRSADLAHWLALDVACRALEDAHLVDAGDLPREATGVFLGNTLTGEFSRSNALRLRWPYVRRVIEATLDEQDWPPDQRRLLVARCEELFKAPFPEVGEETLAGSLSNTIAGRICNHFDLKGGGYTIDGACASSLLAVTTACSALAARDIDVALAGGVDLSIDPFELIGFAKAGALASDKMRVFDARSAGFFPGEGCGVVVLMRLEDAQARNSRIYAVIRGWGVSSDGSGGITRPEAQGQLLALERAYKRAGFGIETVAYFEAHGTGTAIGDATEIKALSLAREECNGNYPAAAIGSVKANIGHTKAAAGVAGLIKATLAVDSQIVPPTTGCEDPLPELTGPDSRLEVLKEGKLWPADSPLRAGVSAMGFGGINTHVVIEGIQENRRTKISASERALLSSNQDAELFLLASHSRYKLLEQVRHLLMVVPKLSVAQLADLAAMLAREVQENRDSPEATRAALVAGSPSELANRLNHLESLLVDNDSPTLSLSDDVAAGVFLGSNTVARIGFLFPGQASPVYLQGGIFSSRFDFIDQVYSQAGLPARAEVAETGIAQPAIITSSLAGLRLMEKLGISADIAVGHSLGEVAALHWAGAFDAESAVRIASARAAAMNGVSGSRGSMASVKATKEEVEALLNGDPVVIACLNSPRQTVVSGATPAIFEFADRVQANGITVTLLPVSYAFHSPMLAPAKPLLADRLSREKFRPLKKRVISTITGLPLSTDEDLHHLLCRQLVAPVRFAEAMVVAGRDADLFIEVGSGQLLTGLASELLDKPVIALDAGGPSLRGLLMAVGAAYAAGAPLDPGPLFADRFTRPFAMNWQPRFFINPCELAPVSEERPKSGKWVTGKIEKNSGDSTQQPQSKIQNQKSKIPSGLSTQDSVSGHSVLEAIRQLLADRVELPQASIKEDDRLLGDLHLNSITVSQLVVEAARRLGLQPPVSPTDYSNVRVGDLAQALEELARTGTASRKAKAHPAGIDHWTRCFKIELVERPRSRHLQLKGESDWRLFAPAGHQLAESLERAFRVCEGAGVVVALPPDVNERHIGLLIEGARAVLSNKRAKNFLLVQHGLGAASFARTLHLEAPWITTCVVNVPPDHPQAVDWLVEELRAATGYVEAHYDSSGTRRVPVLQLLPQSEQSEIETLGPKDVLLVSGGGKGIAAECAVSLVRETGARLVLLGRSIPETDAELAANLDRLTRMGICFKYLAADVTDHQAVRNAISQVQTETGPVTAILHAAGLNRAKLIESLDEESFAATLAPKLQGARNLLESVDSNHLRYFITFGSLIARTGMPGEADYALANEWLTSLTEDWQKKQSHCRCLAIEWSVWSGVGMGQRLGRVDALLAQDITPIPPEEGIKIINALLGQEARPVSVVVTGRFGGAPTLRMESPDLPLDRFLEQPRVYYPGVELVVDSEISIQSDPYLNDHVFKGDCLFPAVMALEAMAQAARALVESAELPVFEEVSFTRALVIPKEGRAILRIATLVRDQNTVEVAIRSDQTAFQVDHCRAVCRFNIQNPGRLTGLHPAPEPQFATLAKLASSAPVPVEPERDLYGRILFQNGRFRRLRSYQKIGSAECVAQVEEASTDWFGAYQSGNLVLGDPARRDASIHSTQVCVPDATLLPVSIDRLAVHRTNATGLCTVYSREMARGADFFTYDLEVRDANGALLEAWEGLRFQVVKGPALHTPWPEPLLGPYIERFIRNSCHRPDVAVVVEPGNGDRQSKSDKAIGRLLGSNIEVIRRPDGKPEVLSNHVVSASHCGDLTLAIAGNKKVACDVERVAGKPTSVWQGLLGEERLRLSQVISELVGENIDTAATRVWSAAECLQKAALPPNAPLVLSQSDAKDWVVLSCGRMSISTLVVSVQGSAEPLVFALLVERNG